MILTWRTVKQLTAYQGLPLSTNLSVVRRQIQPGMAPSLLTQLPQELQEIIVPVKDWYSRVFIALLKQFLKNHSI